MEDELRPAGVDVPLVESLHLLGPCLRDGQVRVLVTYRALDDWRLNCYLVVPDRTTDSVSTGA